MADKAFMSFTQNGEQVGLGHSLLVGGDTMEYRALVSDVAKKIIEDYAGSTLAGSAQSVQAALAALNSNSFSLTSDYTIQGQACGKTGRAVVINAKIQVTAQTAGTTINLATIPTGYRPPSEAPVFLYDTYSGVLAKGWITTAGVIRLNIPNTFSGSRSFYAMTSYYAAS